MSAFRPEQKLKTEIMADCAVCQAFIGARACVEPHDRMIRRRLTKVADGELEFYECLDCGAEWMRAVNPIYAARAENEFWVKK